MTPASPILVELAIALPVAMLVAYVIARMLKRLLRRRLDLPISVMVIVSLVGLSLGLLIQGLFIAQQRPLTLVTLLIAFVSSLVLSFAVAGVLAARGSGIPDTRSLIADGESDRVEFKETARWNIREGKKDARMEHVVAKTVAAFLNADGGTLLIGVTDQGETVGLQRDFSTLREPDADRFELWLRDMLQTSLGKNAAALPVIRFDTVDGEQVCAVHCPRSPEPVFLKQGSTQELWVRVGNSSRSFGVDEAVTYVRRRFTLRRWRASTRPERAG